MTKEPKTDFEAIYEAFGFSPSGFNMHAAFIRRSALSKATYDSWKTIEKLNQTRLPSGARLVVVPNETYDALADLAMYYMSYPIPPIPAPITITHNLKDRLARAYEAFKQKTSVKYAWET